MLYALLKTLHLLSVILWVGGMLFAHFFLRPSLVVLDPPARPRLMQAVLGRFFAAVLAASLLVVATGALMWALNPPLAVPLGWSVMAVAGSAMLVIFLAIRFLLYPRLRRALGAGDATGTAAALAGIRRWVGVNLVLGLAIVVVLRLGPAVLN